MKVNAIKDMVAKIGRKGVNPVEKAIIETQVADKAADIVLLLADKDTVVGFVKIATIAVKKLVDMKILKKEKLADDKAIHDFVVEIVKMFLDKIA